jgi:adenylate cyclase
MSDAPREPAARRFLSAARRINRNPRLVASARRTRERTMGDDEFVDHLSTARGRPADLAARQLVELRGSEHGVMGELGLTALQLWQRVAESQDRGRGKVDVAILFTDLVGFSSWALEAGDRAAVRLLREFAAAVEAPVSAQRGEVVKWLGDGAMAAFWHAPGAAEAAFDAHERIRTVEVEGYRPLLRTGIHLGRPRKLGGDYLGVDVNIAARLADAAKPGEILVSDPVCDLLDPVEILSTSRRFRAKGAPARLGAHAIERRAIG